MRNWLQKLVTDDGRVVEVPVGSAPRTGQPQPSGGASAMEPRFIYGYEARLTVSFSSGRRIGRISAFFVHESDPFARQLAFVEDYEQREKGSKTEMTLVSWFSDDLPTGRYRLQGMQATYLGGKKDGEEAMLGGVPALSFVLTDRTGNIAGSPDPNAPRVRGLRWE